MRAQIQAASRDGDGRDPAVGLLYRALPQDTADTALLRWRLSMTPEAIADLMGIDIPTVTASLLTARRQFSDTALRQLEHRTSRP